MTEKVCLVIGSHPCWEDDYKAASVKYPNHKICAVNHATELVYADYLATSHGDQVWSFLKDSKNPTPHVIAMDNDIAGDVEHKITTYSHGGSGPFAASAMIHIGFDLAVLCGCPINGSGGYATKRINTGFMWDRPEAPRIREWHRGMRSFKEKHPEYANKIRSMSGATKEIFGGIDD